MNRFNKSFVFNISCEDQRTVGIQRPDIYLEDVIRYMTIGSVSFLFPISVCLNMIVILLIANFKHLRQTTYLLALQLILVDLVYTCMNSSVSIISAAFKKWILGTGLCQFTGNMFIFLQFLRSFLMFIFVCDRFCLVFSPFGYSKIRKKTLFALVFASLLLCGVLVITPFMYDCVIFSRFAWHCINTVRGCLKEQSCFMFQATMSVISNIVGNAIPLVMYIVLHIKARKMWESIVVPVAIMSGDILEKKNREKKANYTFLAFFLVTFVFSFMSLFNFLVIGRILRALEVDVRVLLQVFGFIARFYYNLLPILDSIAIMKNKEFHYALKKIKYKLKNRLFA